LQTFYVANDGAGWRLKIAAPWYWVPRTVSNNELRVSIHAGRTSRSMLHGEGPFSLIFLLMAACPNEFFKIQLLETLWDPLSPIDTGNC
jgi:hypothetical protein